MGRVVEVIFLKLVCCGIVGHGHEHGQPRKVYGACVVSEYVCHLFCHGVCHGEREVEVLAHALFDILFLLVWPEDSYALSLHAVDYCCQHIGRGEGCGSVGEDERHARGGNEEVTADDAPRFHDALSYDALVEGLAVVSCSVGRYGGNPHAMVGIDSHGAFKLELCR